MKKLHFLFSFFVCTFFFSQVVNIPDANFKAKLLSANITTNKIAKDLSGNWTFVDTNGDGEIQSSEALALSHLELASYGNSSDIVDITGISAFTNLNFLGLGSNAITSLNLDLDNLLTLNASANPLNSIDIQNCAVIQTLVLGYNNMPNVNITSSTLKNFQHGDSFSPITIDLHNCPNLESVSFFYTPISTLDLSNFQSLKQITIENTIYLTSINLQGSNGLLSVGIRNSGLTTVDLQNLPLLNNVNLWQNTSLSSVNVNNCVNLQTLFLEDNALTSLNVTSLTNLVDLNVKSNDLTSLNLNNLTNLQFANLQWNNINNLNLNNTPNLKNLNCLGNYLSSINLATSPAIQYLDLTDNYLSSLNVSMLPNLISLGVGGNYFPKLDITQNPLLQSLNCSFSGLQYLFLKNGKLNAWNTGINGCSALKYICTDDTRVSDFLSLVNQLSNPIPAVVNSYCTFTPGGIFYTVTGNTKYDFNANGCDSADPIKPFQKFNITNGTVTGSIIANSLGNFSIPVQAGSHTVTPILENPNYFTISPTSFTANFPAQASPLTQNFCITSNGNFNDLEVFVIPVTAAVPGFNAKYKLVFKNKGTTTQSGTLTMSFDDNLMNFNTSTVSPTTQNTGNLSWNFTNLLPFETREIILTFTLNTPTATPALNSGNILSYNAIISGATDETPSDNNFTLNQTVVNSFDPNDKTCLEGTAISTAKVGDYVHYLIRFENNGTANAQNIVVKDVIDINKFDINSLITLNGSHSFVTRITAPNTVEFIFENIQLPFNNATNDGFVTFKIKTKSTLVLGDTFSNSASIYFDYNAPIITNTYTTVVQNILATNEVDNSKDFAIYPNPVVDFAYFKTKEKFLKAEVFDVSGRIILSVGVSNNSADLSSLSKGVYIIKVFTKDKFYLKKLVKK